MQRIITIKDGRAYATSTTARTCRIRWVYTPTGLSARETRKETITVTGRIAIFAIGRRGTVEAINARACIAS